MNRGLETGAGNEIRTRDPNLGKVVLYQLSYSRKRAAILYIRPRLSSCLRLANANYGG